LHLLRLFFAAFWLFASKYALAARHLKIRSEFLRLDSSKLEKLNSSPIYAVIFLTFHEELIICQIVECVVKMANPKHVSVVRKGAAAIEEWRRKHPDEILDLYAADLSLAKLSGVNLSKAYLSMAFLFKADLSNADLSEAKLTLANLDSCNLFKANLSKAHATLTIFMSVNLSGANLSGANLFQSDLSGANLSKANFSGADLSYANFKFAKFLKTDLSNTNLTGALLLNLDAANVNLTGATMNITTLAYCNMAHGVGLEAVKHNGPTFIDYNTLIISFLKAGNQLTPGMEIFFINAGVPRQLLDALPEILEKIQYCSCFICYGQPDLAFAQKLVKDLKVRGISCWLYSLDYTPGEKTWGEITQRRREAEKMIVLCSVKSLMRDGVKKEIEEQKDEDPGKMVPISLDDDWKHEGFQVKRGQRDLKPFLVERNYADFCDESKYNESFNKLLRGIKRKGK
jgi:hypothetical protein